MAARQVEEASVRLLSREHGVDFRGRDVFAGFGDDRGTSLVCAFEVLNGLVGVAPVEIFDGGELSVEFVERVFGRQGVDFLLSDAVGVRLDVQQPIALLLESVDELGDLVVA